MTPRTQIQWLDRDLHNLDSLYIHTPHPQLRQRILASAVTAGASSSTVKLLSFPQNADIYSFNPENVLTQLADSICPRTREERLDIRTIDSRTAVTERVWTTISDSDTIIADSITNLQTGRLGDEALERAATELADRPLLILDSRPPYRALADRVDGIARILWKESGPIKEIHKHPSMEPRTEHITLQDQTTLQDFAEATV